MAQHHPQQSEQGQAHTNRASFIAMDDRRGSNTGGRGRPVSSYASLASGPRPNMEPRRDSRPPEFDDRRSGGFSNPSSNSSMPGRGGRGRGRFITDGRGREAPFRPRRETSPPPDQSGYESGEIMPQRPLAHRRPPREGMDDRRERPDSYNGRPDNYDGPPRGGMDSQRMPLDGRSSLGAGRFPGRGRGRGGRMGERGAGRGRGPMDRPLDSRDSRPPYRSDLPPLDGPSGPPRNEPRMDLKPEPSFPPRPPQDAPPRNFRQPPHRSSFNTMGSDSDSIGRPSDMPPPPMDRFPKRPRTENSSYGEMEDKRPRIPPPRRPADDGAPFPPRRDDPPPSSRPPKDFRNNVDEPRRSNDDHWIDPDDRRRRDSSFDHPPPPPFNDRRPPPSRGPGEGPPRPRPPPMDDKNLPPSQPPREGLRWEPRPSAPQQRSHSPPRGRAPPRQDEPSNTFMDEPSKRHPNFEPKDQPSRPLNFRPPEEDRFQRSPRSAPPLDPPPRDNRPLPWEAPPNALREVPPRPRDLPPPRDTFRDTAPLAPRDIPPRPRDLPPPRDTFRDALPSAPRDLPPRPRDLPPPRDAFRDAPPNAPRDVPPRPRDLPPPRDTFRDGPPGPPRDLPPPRARDSFRDVPPNAPRDLPPRPRDLPPPRDGFRDVQPNAPRDMPPRPRDIPPQRDAFRDGPWKDDRPGFDDGFREPQQQRPVPPFQDRPMRPPPGDRGMEFRPDTVSRPGGPPRPPPPPQVSNSWQSSGEPLIVPIVFTPPPPPSDVGSDVSRPLSVDNRGGPPFPGRGMMGGRGRGRGRGPGRGRGRGDYGGPPWGGRGPMESYTGMPSPRDNSMDTSPMPSPRMQRPMWTPNNGGVPVDTREQPRLPPMRNEALRPVEQQSMAPVQVLPPSQRIPNTEEDKVEQKASPEPMEVEKSPEPTPEPTPRAVSPPPPGEPSGVMVALARLADIEEQMEYAYAKHMQLVKRQKELELQTAILKTLPVGMDAFKEEYKALLSSAEP